MRGEEERGERGERGGEEEKDALVLGEPARVARAHPPLREDADRHGRVDRGVDAHAEVARVLEDDRRAEVLEASLRPDVPL